ncbi:MAG TPA: YciI family protein [Candidatus Polarisedimenticolaceae bacterium]|nr:YciI family protein [Candidatus Polarisedimenticolaceae bacterium]
MKMQSFLAFAALVLGVPAVQAESSALDRFKGLSGDWVAAEDGPMAKKGDLVATYRLTGGGTAVVEEIFPATARAMTTVYHQDGADLVLTHYCMSGNQPRMRAKATEGKKVSFAFDGGTNLDPAKDEHMHAATFTFLSADEIRSEWVEHAGGKPKSTVSMHLTRKKDAKEEKGGSKMKYLLLIYQDEGSWAGLSEAEQGKLFEEYMTYTRNIKKDGNYLGGEALQPVATATTVRVRNGKTMTTDGPFAETREQLGGYYLVEAKDLDEAIQLATGIPDVRMGSIEVRPIMPTPPVD